MSKVYSTSNVNTQREPNKLVAVDPTIITDDQFGYVDFYTEAELVYPDLAYVSMQGSIDSSSPEDWYQIQLEAGVTVIFDIDMPGLSFGDSIITLYNAEMLEVGRNDDDADYASRHGEDNFLESYLEYTPTLSGIYYIQVTDYQLYADAVDYTLNISKAELTSFDNVAPVAVYDAFYEYTEDSGEITIDVLANDTDLNGDMLTVISVESYEGLVVINPDGTLTFTAYDNSIATIITIFYEISDGELTDWASANIYLSSYTPYEPIDTLEPLDPLEVVESFKPINNDPIALNDTSSTKKDTSVSINVLVNDSDADVDLLTVLTADANNGVVTINNDGTLDYTPNAGFIGTDVISYSITDVPQKSFTHSFTFTNPEVFGEKYDQFLACMDAALVQWENVLPTNHDVNIEIEIVGVIEPYEYYLANAMSGADYFESDILDPLTGNSIWFSPVQHEITTGEDLNSSSEADAIITINLAYMDDFWLDPTPYDLNDNVPLLDEYDFRGLMMHELGHPLGFDGFLQYASLDSNELTSWFWGDTNIYDTFIAWDSTLDSYVFTGANALNAYHSLGFEGYLPLYSSGYSPGSDLAHYGFVTYFSRGLDFYLMSAASYPGQVDQISVIDLGILADLGYDISTQGSDSPITASVEMNVYSPITIKDSYGNLIDNMSISFVSNDVVSNPIAIEQGCLDLTADLGFDTVNLSEQSAYQGDINILDMYAALNLFGQEVGSMQTHAADVNNDGAIDMIDLTNIISQIGERPMEFDLVDQQGQRTSQLIEQSLTNDNSWALVANGDVDLSSGFDSTYITTAEIV